MKKYIFTFLCLSIIILNANAQSRKLITEINSIASNETIIFKYNSKNQLTDIEEKGPIVFRVISLKYDKKSGRLTEYTINQDRGEFLTNTKFGYDDAGNITQEVKSSRKKIEINAPQFTNIQLDDKGRLLKTFFEGKLWEEFVYDDNDNLAKYVVYSVSGRIDQESEYTHDDKTSALSGMENLPKWFWALNLNSMKWCAEFIGKNNAVEDTTEYAKYSAVTTEITYNYDADGYPLKQYHDGVLAKEFSYKGVK